MLFNEPKLLKWRMKLRSVASVLCVSVLFNEPKLLKSGSMLSCRGYSTVSVLFNEPKLLKYAKYAVILVILT